MLDNDSKNITPIVEEMKRSYLNYAMSVIVSRALPDVKDGLKPVHRRILYAMHKLGLTRGARFSKSAKVVGEVLGKYHPHGDSAVYDALVRMGQLFSMRYPLILGQGNFGSIDGDPPAAMRLTEVIDGIIRMMTDIKEVKEKETKVAEAADSGGIFVYTSLIDEKKSQKILFTTPVASLMEHILGPDFPTAANIYGVDEIQKAYATGKGKIMVRATVRHEDTKGGKDKIIIDQLPYQVNKANLVKKIADLVKDKKVIGISDLRDESDRDGIRVVIELKRDAVYKKILNN